jgi:CRP-like cAMP-binding protein/ferredoxin
MSEGMTNKSSGVAIASPAQSSAKRISVTIDGRRIIVDAGTTVWEAARQNGIDIPALCHTRELGYNPVAVCRVCAVNVLGKNGKPEPQYAASCVRECKEGMTVVAHDEKLDAARKTLIELLLAEHPVPCERQQETGDCELEAYGLHYGLLKETGIKAHDLDWVRPTVFQPRVEEYIRKPDTSNFSIHIDHAACILCDRCIRACSDPKVNHLVIGRVGKGADTHIGFDNDLDMKDSSCVNCGYCMISCPTGAITYTGEGRPKEPPPGIVLSAEEIQEKLPPIQNGRISPQFLKRSEGGVSVHRFDKGQVICRQGEYGRTAFYINSGKVDVYLELQSRDAAAPAERGLWDRLFGGKPAASPTPAAPRTTAIPVGGGIELDPAKPIAQMGVGALFGEASCLNGEPRSATVRAAEDGTEIVIMFRNFLDILSRNREFRAKLEENYRRRIIDNFLRRNEVLKELTTEFIDELREKLSLVRYSPGEIICRQGDAADAFYLVRLGHVKVDKRFDDGSQMTIRYMSQGQAFGEIGVLLAPFLRTTTCLALDNVELIRIGKTEFDLMIEHFPAIGRRLREKAEQLIRGDPLSSPQTGDLTRRQTSSLREYLDQELYQAQHMLVIDLESCTRCDECVRACAQSHLGITRLIRDGLRYDNYLVTTSCRSCRDPKCLSGCPVDAIHRKGGLPILIEDHCVGCGKCAENCPYGNITMHPIPVVDPFTHQVQEGRRAMVCNLDNCIEEKREPSCVYACPHDAAHRVDGPKFFGADVLGR